MIVHFITSNQHKWEETYPVLSPIIHLIRKKLDLQEIQAANLEKIVSYKLKQAYHAIKGGVICEDTALYIKQLGDFPGPYVKYFIDQVGIDKIATLVGGSEAVAHTCYGYYDGEKEFFFHGKVEGRVSEQKRGAHNPFGFTPIFIPSGATLTYAEMPFKMKRHYSQRVKALEKIKNHFLAR